MVIDLEVFGLLQSGVEGLRNPLGILQVERTALAGYSMMQYDIDLPGEFFRELKSSPPCLNEIPV